MQNLQHKKLFFIAPIVLLCALAISAATVKHNTAREQQRVKREQMRTADIMQKPAYQAIERIANKKRELDKLHIAGKERDRLFNQERNAAVAEYNRVAASDFKKPYDMNSR